MEIVLARLDNRLLHGIVATQWVQHSRCDRLMIIDDETATDLTKKEIMRIAKPGKLPLSIITLDTAINNFKAGKYDGKRIFVVTKKPDVLKDLDDAGINIDEITIGGSAGGPEETIRLSKRYACTPEEKADLDELARRGLNLYSQYIPADAKEPFKA